MIKLLSKKISVLITLLLVATITTQATLGQTIVQAAEPSNTENLKMNKSVDYNDDGSYNITLDAYATGNVSVVTKSKPVDTVLVLDVSYSMNEGVNRKDNYVAIVPEDSSPFSTVDYQNNPDYYYVYDEASKKIIPLFKTSEYQYGTKIKEHPNGGIVSIDERYQVYAYTDDKGNMYVPAQGSSTPEKPVSYATKIVVGSAEDQERFKSYKVATFYRHNDTEFSGPRKIDVLKQSVTNFINEASKDGVNHRFSIITFSDDTKLKTDFIDVSDAASKQRLLDIINGLSLEGGTNPELGMQKAIEVVNGNALQNDPERNKALILFTDGIPDVYNRTKESVVNGTITASKTIKDKGYTVYSAGISNLLDNTLNPATISKRNEVGLMNLYMQYVSSNFPNSISVDQAGDNGNYEDGKFLYASDEESFKKMFEQIRDEISTTNSTLDENTELIDYVSDEFILDMKSVEVYTQEYLGNQSWGELVPFADAKVSVDKNDQSVIVKGFSYKDNFVIEDGKQGKRLVVKLKVNSKDGFIGGNKVATNKEASGIYHSNEVVKKFNQPVVNVPINYVSKDSETSIYIMSNAENTTDIVDANPSVEGIQFLYRKDNSDIAYTLDGINNKYVTVKYIIQDGGGNTIGEGDVAAGGTTINWTTTPNTTTLTSNTVLKVKTMITPISNPTQGDQVVARQKTNETKANINVFQPIVTVENDTVFAGEYYDLNSVIKAINWHCPDNTSASFPKGNAPVLKHKFYDLGGNVIPPPNDFYIGKTSEFTMSTSINNDKIDAYTTIRNSEKPETGDFIIRAVTGELSITKTMDAPFTQNKATNSNQTFVFQVTRRHVETKDIIETYYQTIDFDQYDIKAGNTSKTVTLKGLKKGIYEVKEDSAWSWKYNFVSSKTNYNNSTDSLYIGEKLGDHYYFGTETGTKINNQDIGNPGNITITNSLNRNLNVIGDCADAINKFVK